MKRVVWFQEVDKDDVGLAGGKGSNLGELTKAKIPVPSGFIVTSHTYFDFLGQSGLKPKISDLLSNLDPNDSARLQRVADEIKRLITESKMPRDVAAEIRRVRPPEPYKGKGIRYVGEHVRTKAGKTGAAKA